MSPDGLVGKREGGEVEKNRKKRQQTDAKRCRKLREEMKRKKKNMLDPKIQKNSRRTTSRGRMGSNIMKGNMSFRCRQKIMTGGVRGGMTYHQVGGRVNRRREGAKKKHYQSLWGGTKCA